MTTENKSKPAFYIFAKSENGENKRIGAAFKHNKGNGLNIVINGVRYTAFPPKDKGETAKGEGA